MVMVSSDISAVVGNSGFKKAAICWKLAFADFWSEP